MIREATRSTTPLSSVGTAGHGTNAKSPPKPSSARSSVQGESTVRSLTHNAPRMTHGRAGRLYYERPATVHGARAKAQSEQGAAPLKNTVAPVVMFHLLDKIKDPSIRGKHAVVTKESLLGYLRMSRCPFRGGEALLASMFHEADFRCTGRLLPDDLKAALTERFVFRKHNGDWRRFAATATGVSDISDLTAKPKLRQVEPYVSTNTPVEGAPRPATHHGARRRSFSTHAPTGAWASFKDRMAHHPTGGGVEDVEMVTPWGPKTLMQTRTELSVNGRLGAAAAGMAAAEAGDADAGAAAFKATLGATAKFHAFNGGLKLLEVPRHQSTLQARTPPRQPLYSRPITAPPPSQLVEARSARLRVPVVEAAAPPPKPFDAVPVNPADGITMRRQAAAEQVGFAGAYLSLLEQTDVFRKPFPGDPMLNQMLEKHYSALLPRPLKPRVDDHRSLGYATDLRTTLLCEEMAAAHVSQAAASLLPPTFVPATKPDPATQRRSRITSRRNSVTASAYQDKHSMRPQSVYAPTEAAVERLSRPTTVAQQVGTTRPGTAAPLGGSPMKRGVVWNVPTALEEEELMQTRVELESVHSFTSSLGMRR